MEINAVKDQAEINRAYYSTVEELPNPVKANVKGTVPSWLHGTLIRVGPGKYEWGTDHYRHAFDGDAIVHNFTIENGDVAFHSRYLRSDSFRESEKHNRIMRSQFGTVAAPDPCANIFWRFFSYFVPPVMTDNCNVNIVKIDERFYATTEATKLWQVDPRSLQTLKDLNFGKFLGEMRSWTAHPHYEPDGSTYQVSSNYLKRTLQLIRYNSAEPNAAQVLATFPVKNFCYLHSFGVTENYVVIFQNPLHFQTRYFPLMQITGWSYKDLLSWRPEQRSEVWLVSKKTWARDHVISIAPLFIFHHVNAFERNGDVVVDVVAYRNGEIIDSLALDALQNNPEITSAKTSEFRRYVFSVKSLKADGKRPVRQPVDDSGKDFELICTGPELPTINYDRVNGKVYRFCYAMSNFRQLVKIDVDTKETWYWSEPNHVPTEPIFVPSPHATAEDDGIVLTSVTGVRGQQSFLLILDGKTFKEIGRALVDGARVPLSFHGLFTTGNREDSGVSATANN